MGAVPGESELHVLTDPPPTGFNSGGITDRPTGGLLPVGPQDLRGGGAIELIALVHSPALTGLPFDGTASERLGPAGPGWIDLGAYDCWGGLVLRGHPSRGYCLLWLPFILGI